MEANLFNRLFHGKQPKNELSASWSHFGDLSSADRLLSNGADPESNKQATAILMTLPVVQLAGNESSNPANELDNKPGANTADVAGLDNRWANKTKTDQLMVNYTLALLEQLESKINELEGQLSKDSKTGAGQWKKTGLTNLRNQLDVKREIVRGMQNRPLSFVDRTRLYSTSFVTKALINALDLVLLTNAGRNPAANSTTPTNKLKRLF